MESFTNMQFDEATDIDFNEQDEEVDETLAIRNPVNESVGTYSAQFESIRQVVFQDLQRAGSEYCMNVQKLVKACVSSNLEIFSLAKLHALNIQKRFANQSVKLLNHTVSNAMYEIDGRLFLIEFNLDLPSQSIVSAKYMQEVSFHNHFDCISAALLAKHCQVLIITPINDEIAIKYEQLKSNIKSSRLSLVKSKKMLQETIYRRAFTAFDFSIGMSFYTLNYSDDMSMIFWDRYTIVDITAKSFYVEQHCIVEHFVTGDVESERFIALHKPSKNSMSAFLANRLACLTDMIRPQPCKVVDETLEIEKFEIHEED